MPDASEDAPDNAPLVLRDAFPPVPTAEWEALARADVRGDDADRRLTWRPEDGIVVKPFYRSDDLVGLDRQIAAEPGIPPFVRGDGTPCQPQTVPAWPPDAIRADRLHDAGATAVQELSFAIAEAVDRIAAAASSGAPAGEAAARIELVFAVGSTYFIEIAKLRAARLLWAAVLEAFDVPAHAVRLHVRTAHADKSVLDPWTNLLRATTEAMSAAIGTADTLLVEAYGYDAHLAANVAHILAEEAHLDAVADPAGGSYYVESLTDALAREAWMLFQQVEAAGGYAAFVASGQRDAQVHVSRAAREAAVASRRRILVSVNSYPSPAGSESAASPWPEADAGDGLSAARLAVPFEAIRARTARHTAATGHTPVVHLLTRGDVRVSTSRATFCRNVFGCAGFDVTQGESLPAHADLVVLCGPDNEYVALAQELVGETSAPVLVAGYPTTLIDALTSAGVQGFVHVRSDIVETLSSWQDRLGLAP